MNIFDIHGEVNFFLNYMLFSILFFWWYSWCIKHFSFSFQYLTFSPHIYKCDFKTSMMICMKNKIEKYDQKKKYILIFFWPFLLVFLRYRKPFASCFVHVFLHSLVCHKLSKKNSYVILYNINWNLAWASNQQFPFNIKFIIMPSFHQIDILHLNGL